MIEEKKVHSDKEVVLMFNEFIEFSACNFPETNLPYLRDTFLKEKGLIKEEFEVGDYYMLNDENDVIVQRIDCSLGRRINKGKDIFMTQISLWTKLTPDQIKEALIKEFEKDGYHYVNYRFINGLLQGTNAGLYVSAKTRWKTLFNNGKWAEIIEDKEEKIQGLVDYLDGVIIELNRLNKLK